MVLILKNGMTCNTVTRIRTVRSTGLNGEVKAQVSLSELLLLTQCLFLKEQRSNCRSRFHWVFNSLWYATKRNS